MKTRKHSGRFLLITTLALGLSPACGDDDSTAGAPESSSHGGTAADSGGRDASAHDAGTSDAGPSDGAAAQSAVLVGAVADSDIALGAVVAGARVRLFFCGGATSYATATRWLLLDLDADGKFASSDDDYAVQGTVHDGALSGELTRAGEPDADFNAELVREDTLAGLYETRDDCGALGLIVTQRSAHDAAQAQGACVGTGHLPEQVNPILPIARDDNGTIDVELIDADGNSEPSSVHPAAAP